MVLATELGESQVKDKYLMRSQEDFALGCVYKDWQYQDTVKRSFAVVTRPPHPRFSKYHEKSIPMFLPLDEVVIKEWLDPSIETSTIIERVVDNLTITTDLEVTWVKTYKNAEAFGAPEILARDLGTPN